MPSHKKFKWHKIADGEYDIPFGSNNMAQVSAGNKSICISKTVDGLKACAATCPHAGGILSEGFIDNSGNIVCPLHRYKFNLINGRNTSGEGYYLKVYPLEIRENGIFVGIEEKSIFRW
jgi:3-phenylpropionate/trans-cinnamate dioxygenase ferredoxin subunit